MPEDEVIEEEISEQEPDPDAEAGFDEFAEEKPEEEEEPEKKEPEAKPDEEKPSEDKEEAELTAKEAVDKRIEELQVEKPEDDKKIDAEKKQGEVKKQEPPTVDELPPVSKRLTKEQLSQHLGVISDDDLPEGDVIIGDNTFNFQELKEDDPQAYNAMKVISSIAGAKYMNAALESGKLVTADVVEELKNEVAGVRDFINFSSEMTNRGHGDFLGVINSDGYKKWIENESEGVKTLASSPDIEDSVRVLNYYKEGLAKTKTSEHDSAAAEKHDRKNKLLKGKKTTKPAGPGKKSDENDDEAAFDEFADAE